MARETNVNKTGILTTELHFIPSKDLPINLTANPITTKTKEIAMAVINCIRVIGFTIDKNLEERTIANAISGNTRGIIRADFIFTLPIACIIFFNPKEMTVNIKATIIAPHACAKPIV